MVYDASPVFDLDVSSKERGRGKERRRTILQGNRGNEGARQEDREEEREGQEDRECDASHGWT